MGTTRSRVSQRIHQVMFTPLDTRKEQAVIGTPDRVPSNLVAVTMTRTPSSSTRTERHSGCSLSGDHRTTIRASASLWTDPATCTPLATTGAQSTSTPGRVRATSLLTYRTRTRRSYSNTTLQVCTSGQRCFHRVHTPRAMELRPTGQETYISQGASNPGWISTLRRVTLP